MARKAETKNDTEMLVIVPTLPEIVSDNLIKQATDAIDQGFKDQVDQALKDYKGLIIAGTNDKDGYNTVSKGIRVFVTLRNEIEKGRKRITDPAVKFQKDVKTHADALIASVLEVESHLNKQKALIDQKALEEKKAEQTRRRKELADNGWKFDGSVYVCGLHQLSPESLDNLTPEQLAKFVKIGADEVARIAAAAEAKRIEDEARAAEAQRLEDLRLAMIQREKDLAAREALLAEREAAAKVVEPEPEPETEAEAEQPAEEEAPEVEQTPEIKAPESLGSAFGTNVPDLRFERNKNPEVLHDPSPKAPQGTGKLIEQPAADPRPITNKTPDYMIGFTAAKVRILEIMKGPDKLTRAEWIARVEQIQP